MKVVAEVCNLIEKREVYVSFARRSRYIGALINCVFEGLKSNVIDDTLIEKDERILQDLIIELFKKRFVEVKLNCDVNLNINYTFWHQDQEF